MFATTTDELLLIFRHEVDDLAAPFLWSDHEVFAYMTEAVDATAKATHTMQRVATIDVKAGEAYTPLPTSVLHINSARLLAAKRPLHEVNAEDTVYGGRDYGACNAALAYASDSQGTPRAYLRDYARQALRLIPIPVEDDMIEIQCSATPAVPMLPGALLPMRDSEDLRLVLLWMKHRAYDKHDVEAYDLARSREYRMEFERAAKQRRADINNYRRRPGATGVDW